MRYDQNTVIIFLLFIMSTVIGLFTDSKNAGDVVGDLKAQGYTEDISIVAKDVNQSGTTSAQVKQEVSDGATAGAATGAAMGAIGALLVGAASFALPGVGAVVLGPLATLLAGTATGAVAGGLVGALVDWGIPEEKAKDFENRINSGEVLVAVKTDSDTQTEVQSLFENRGASETYITNH